MTLKMFNYLIILMLTLTYCSLVSGQHEFKINTYSDSTQREPRVASNSLGNYAVVWTSYGQDGSGYGIFGQLYDANDNKVNSEFMVNTTTKGDQIRPAIAMNDEGRFVVSWTCPHNDSTKYDIYGQLFDATGNRIGNEFLVNTFQNYSQNHSAVAIDDNGNFCIVWHSWNQDGGDKGVYGQIFNADGSKKSDEFLINTTTAYSQTNPVIDMKKDGSRFIVVWESWMQDVPEASGYGVYGQLFDAAGNKIGGEFQANSYTDNYQWQADVDMNEDGSFIVVWTSWEQDGDEGGIFGQRFDANANKIGEEFQVNTSTGYYQWLPIISIYKDSSYSVVWSSWKQDGSREGVFGQFFNKDGNKVGFEFPINDFTENYQWEPTFFQTKANQLLAVWSSWNQDGTDYSIYGRRCDIYFPTGKMKNRTIKHIEGRCSGEIIIYVVDSTALTGNDYEIQFRNQNDTLGMDINNLTTESTVIQNFLFDKGFEMLYITKPFDGVQVKVEPVADLHLDLENSKFVTHSNTNMQCTIRLPSGGHKELAPIDIALIWNDTDTSDTGDYLTPGDTARSTQGIFDIQTPFRVRNITDDAKVFTLVLEQNNSRNKRWDPGDRIIFLTPQPYYEKDNSTHAQVNTSFPEGSTHILPSAGDTIFVYTQRPFTAEDKFVFRTDAKNYVNIHKRSLSTETFTLLQNYPNPFNLSTSIKYNLPVDGRVKLEVFNLLGEKVVTLINEKQRTGIYKIIWNGKNDAGMEVSSGLYFYRLIFGKLTKTSKMILIK